MINVLVVCFWTDFFLPSEDNPVCKTLSALSLLGECGLMTEFGFGNLWRVPCAKKKACIRRCSKIHVSHMLYYAWNFQIHCSMLLFLLAIVLDTIQSFSHIVYRTWWLLLIRTVVGVCFSGWILYLSKQIWYFNPSPTAMDRVKGALLIAYNDGVARAVINSLI